MKTLPILKILENEMPFYQCDPKQADHAYHYGWNAAVTSSQLNAAVHNIIIIHGEASKAHADCIDGYREAVNIMRNHNIEQDLMLKPYIQ